MKTVTVRVDDLLQVVDAGIPIVGVQFFILQEEWRKLPQGSKLILAPLKASRKLKFIDVNRLFHSEIYLLQKLFGTGIAFRNYLILKFCMNEQIEFVTDDDNIVRIAQGLGVTTRKTAALRLDMKLSTYRQVEKPLQNVKRIRNDMEHKK